MLLVNNCNPVRFPFDGYLNVYEAEPSWQVSSSQGSSINYVQFGFTLGLLWVYFWFTFVLFLTYFGFSQALSGFFMFVGYLNDYKVEASWKSAAVRMRYKQFYFGFIKLVSAYLGFFSSGSTRFSQVLSGSLRFSQVLLVL